MSRFLWSHWSASWPALIIYAAVAGAHLAGLRRLLSGGDPADPPAGRRATIREAAVFQGGLLLALLVIVSPLGYWSRIYIWVRALDDLTLAFMVPGPAGSRRERCVRPTAVVAAVAGGHGGGLQRDLAGRAPDRGVRPDTEQQR